MLVLMKQASIHTYFENMAMLQKVKKYTTKSVKKHKQIGIVAAKIDKNLSHPWNLTELWTAFYLNLGLKNVFYL